MRTAPLRGLREQPFFLHDGRAATVEDAILMHRGQGQRARDQFKALTRKQKDGLLAFLNPSDLRHVGARPWAVWDRKPANRFTPAGRSPPGKSGHLPVGQLANPPNAGTA